jgi:hypothetical protein
MESLAPRMRERAGPLTRMLRSGQPNAQVVGPPHQMLPLWAERGEHPLAPVLFRHFNAFTPTLSFPIEGKGFVLSRARYGEDFR